jgi:glycosyltransferase involved in cell wall biosynthesis
MSKSAPLVSVVAISYNQEEYVIECLDSILRQSYSNIELIVSDDSSSDETLRLIRLWLDQHRTRFIRTEIITSNENFGICKNLSNGLRSARGYWIKPIACDDILDVNAISQYVEYAQERCCELIFSQLEKFEGKSGSRKMIGKYLSPEQVVSLSQKTDILVKDLIYTNILPAPSAFYSRRLLECVGGVDTNFKHLDDWPLWLRMLPKISMLGWIDKSLVLYRVSEKSLSQSKDNKPIRDLLYQDHVLLYKNYQKSMVNILGRWDLYLQYLRRKIVFEYLGNKRLAFVVLMPLQLLSPQLLIRKASKK